MKNTSIIIFMFCLIGNMFYGQTTVKSQLWIKKLDDNNKYGSTKYQIHYEITNISKETIMIVLDTTGFESYDEYNWYGYKYPYNEIKKRKPFAPRLNMLDKKTKDTLDWGMCGIRYDWVKEAFDSVFAGIKIKEKKELSRLKEIKRRLSLNKDINWIAYYDYIVNHTVILEPDQSINVFKELCFDDYYYDELLGTRGFCVCSDIEYIVNIKLYQSRKWLLEHLTKDIIEKYQKQKIIIYNGTLFSNDVIINEGANGQAVGEGECFQM